MKYKRTLGFAAALALVLAAGGARAHVVLVPAQAAPGTRYEAALRVPHGCQGAATTGLRLRIPDGLVDVQVQDKPGWVVQVMQADYAQPLVLRGATLTRGVREINWAGSLPDGEAATFAFSGELVPGLPQDELLYFPVLQQCGDAVLRWIDRSGAPAAGHPAPTLQLVAPGGTGHAASD